MRACLFIVGSLLLSRAALAQDPDPRILRLLERQARVVVLDNNGLEWSGRLLRIDPASLTLATAEGPHSVPRAAVAEIYRRGDSLVSGIAIGAVTGAILGVWFTKETGCGALLSGYEPCSVRSYVEQTAFASGLGAGAGLAIDALVRGRTRIYPHDTRTFWPEMRVTPQVVPRGAAVVLSTRW
jgi:hypothetical protein